MCSLLSLFNVDADIITDFVYKIPLVTPNVIPFVAYRGTSQGSIRSREQALFCEQSVMDKAQTRSIHTTTNIIAISAIAIYLQNVFSISSGVNGARERAEYLFQIS